MAKKRELIVCEVAEDWWEAIFEGDELIQLIHSNDGGWDHHMDDVMEHFGIDVKYIDVTAMTKGQKEAVKDELGDDYLDDVDLDLEEDDDEET